MVPDSDASVFAGGDYFARGERGEGVDEVCVAVEFQELGAVFGPDVDYTKHNCQYRREGRGEGVEEGRYFFWGGGIWGANASLPQEAKPRLGSSQRPLTTSVCFVNTLICLSPLQYRIVLSADANYQSLLRGNKDQ